MPISGLVVTLSRDPHLRELALAAINREPRIETGVMEAGRLAIVVETDSPDDDRDVWQWLGSLPGVDFVDVALIGFE
jgi:nitrate reductase NapAB chaperone NapD